MNGYFQAADKGKPILCLEDVQMFKRVWGSGHSFTETVAGRQWGEVACPMPLGQSQGFLCHFAFFPKHKVASQQETGLSFIWMTGTVNSLVLRKSHPFSDIGRTWPFRIQDTRYHFSEWRHVVGPDEKHMWVFALFFMWCPFTLQILSTVQQVWCCDCAVVCCMCAERRGGLGLSNSSTPLVPKIPPKYEV